MDIDLLVKISARAWAMPILALLHRGTPGRQASLLAATGAGRTAFTPSLHHLIDLGLLERNPGHGHPLRPEYRLTPDGHTAAAMAHRLDTALPGAAQTPLLRRAWTLPILAVSRQPRHFSDIKSALGPITDRALSQSLRQLQGAQWITRAVDPAATPLRARYGATGTGLRISKAIDLSPVP